MKVFLLGSLILVLSAVCLATSFDYASKGSIGAGTATLKGNATVGGTLTLTSPLIDISATGTVTLATGTLAATSNPNIFDFTGGSLTIISGANTLFHGTFSSGTLTVLGPSSFTISGMLSNGAVFTTQTYKHGDVLGNTVVTPEPQTYGLVATGIGLIGLAGITRRKSSFRWIASALGRSLPLPKNWKHKSSLGIWARNGKIRAFGKDRF